MDITIENANDRWTAFLCGRLDTANAYAFEDGVKPLTEHADKTLLIDCSRLEYISSSGLRQFLALRKAVAAKGGKMIIANLSNGLKDIFKMTGFSTLFDFE
jgi:anti-sigma B factor antagonist